MKILAVESSGLTASAAVVEDDILKTEFTVSNKLTHSETLLPMIRQMLDISGIDKSSLDAIAVSAGPGSFTGLRIGAATAKGLALALNIPVISVSTLEAMGCGISVISDAVICPVMDARRGQVYSAAFRGGACLVDEAPRDIREFLGLLELLDGTEDTEFVFVGDGVPVNSDIITELLSRDVVFAGAQFNRQRAAGVAETGAVIYKRWLVKNSLTAEYVRKAGADSIDCFDDMVMNSDSFVPKYMRKTQAEREMAAGLLEDPGLHSLKKLRAENDNG